MHFIFKYNVNSIDIHFFAFRLAAIVEDLACVLPALVSFSPAVYNLFDFSTISNAIAAAAVHLPRQTIGLVFR